MFLFIHHIIRISNLNFYNNTIECLCFSFYFNKTYFIFDNGDVFDNGDIQYKWIHALLVFRHLVELSINVAQKE